MPTTLQSPEEELWLPGLGQQTEIPFCENAYQTALAKSGAEEAFLKIERECGPLHPKDTTPPALLSAAENLSFAIFDALDAGALDDRCGISLNYSSGKDSTLMLSLFLRWMIQRKAKGLNLRPLVVGIADTGSEMPSMERRMEEEAESIRLYAEETGLPIKVFLERPPYKNYLLVEILGNGKPLPRITRGGTGNQASEWCMDRVKKTTLDGILKRLKEEFPFFVSLLGVRSDESNRREAVIEQYSNGAPKGLCRMGGAKETRQVGCIPIAHWNKNLMRHFLLLTQNSEESWELLPWRPHGGPELNRIYRDAAGTWSGNGPVPFECQLTITKDGSISNSCSDLSGTRMGCWMCLLSKNKSLSNTAKARPNHAWLKKFHGYLFGHHRRNFERAALRDSLGFNKDTLFPKGFTFSERYFLTMLLARAEIESKITLLKPEMEAVIETLWRKHGVQHLTVADARQDAALWKKTGKPIPCFATGNDPRRSGALSRILGLSLPSGAFWEPPAESGLKQKLELLHLLALRNANAGDPLLPTLRAHLFVRAKPTKEQHGDILVLVTDTPSVLGTKTNTGLINGLCGANWVHQGDREPTRYEQKLSDGRTILYMTTWEKENQEVSRLLNSGKEKEAAARGSTLWANAEISNTGCPSDPLADEWHRQSSEQELKGKLSAEDFRKLFLNVQAAVECTEILDEKVAQRTRETMERAQSRPELLEQSNEEGRLLRASLRTEARENLDITSLRPLFVEYQEAAGSLATALRTGKATLGLLEKIAYIVRTQLYDPPYAEEQLFELCKRLDIKHPEKQPYPSNGDTGKPNHDSSCS